MLQLIAQVRHLKALATLTCKTGSCGTCVYRSVGEQRRKFFKSDQGLEMLEMRAIP